MIFNVHAGHNPDGKTACGAIGLIKESTEARKVANEVITLLKQQGHTVYNCTEDNGTSQNDVLTKIVKKCNTHKVDLDVSIHFNAGANDRLGNGKSCGTEVLVNKVGNSATKYAKTVCESISKLGFRNRGVKESGVYFLRKTNAPAILIECCFVDDKDDVNMYNYKTMALAIVKGILGDTTPLSTNKSNEENKVENKAKEYGLKIYSFKNKEDALNFKAQFDKAFPNAYNEIYEV